MMTTNETTACNGGTDTSEEFDVEVITAVEDGYIGNTCDESDA